MVSLAVAIVTALSLHSATDTTHAARNDIALAHPDSLQRRDTLPPLDTTSGARIDFDFGTGAGPAMRALSLEFGVSTAPNPYVRNQVVATTRLSFVRRPDSLSAEFARRVSSAERIPMVEVEIRPAAGEPPMVVRMHDVQVVSTKVSANGDDATLRQQRLGLTESVAQVRADLEEAERQLSVTSSLEKRHLASSGELARARGAMALLTARLVVQQQRLGLIEHQLADWLPFEEEVVLAAAKMDAITHTGAQ